MKNMSQITKLSEQHDVTKMIMIAWRKSHLDLYQEQKLIYSVGIAFKSFKNRVFE